MSRSQLIKLPGLDEEAMKLDERFPPASELIPSELEFHQAQLSPPCVVENYLWEDVGVLFAPGGTGKTTLIIYEAICIALGRRLWGLTIISPGKTLIISAEDPRGILIARIRSICLALNLSESEIRLVRESVLVLDVSTKFVKLIEDTANKGITVSADAASICAAYSSQNIRLVIVDPAISFGVSESKVNDNEQGLVMAGRSLVKGLGACVRYIHHTGKAGADREKQQTQYSGRGGSALPDGCRMVAGISEADSSSLPTGAISKADSPILLLTRHKSTYCKKQPELFIIRDGYDFSYITKEVSNPEERLNAQKRQIQNWIYQAERSRNLFLSKSAIEDGYLKEIGITKQLFRTALAQLKSEQVIIDMELPEHLKRGARQEYLHARFDSSIPPSIEEKANPVTVNEATFP